MPGGDAVQVKVGTIRGPPHHVVPAQVVAGRASARLRDGHTLRARDHDRISGRDGEEMEPRRSLLAAEIEDVVTVEDPPCPYLVRRVADPRLRAGRQVVLHEVRPLCPGEIVRPPREPDHRCALQLRAKGGRRRLVGWHGRAHARIEIEHVHAPIPRRVGHSAAIQAGGAPTIHRVRVFGARREVHGGTGHHVPQQQVALELHRRWMLGGGDKGHHASVHVAQPGARPLRGRRWPRVGRPRGRRTEAGDGHTDKGGHRRQHGHRDGAAVQEWDGRGSRCGLLERHDTSSPGRPGYAR